jgi:hypothetical protein
MISLILSTLVSLQISAPPQETYTFKFQQKGSKKGVVTFSVVPQPGFKWAALYKAKPTRNNNKNVVPPKTSFPTKNKDFVLVGKNGVATTQYRLKSGENQVVEGVASLGICKADGSSCRPYNNKKGRFVIQVK